MDPGKGKLITATKKFNNKISQGSKAKNLVSKLEKVFIDPTASSKDDAGYRANYLIENMSYRFGTLEADILGLPELVPGRFIQIAGLGKDVANVFYLQEVIHTFASSGDFVTRIIGKAATITDPISYEDAAAGLTGGVDSVLGSVGDVAGSVSSLGGGLF